MDVVVGRLADHASGSVIVNSNLKGLSFSDLIMDMEIR